MSQIITIDDLNSYMGKSLTAGTAQQVVDGVNSYIEDQTHRSWGEVKEATETHDWSRVIYLNHQDVVSVASVKSGFPGQEQTTLTTDSYYSNPLGRLTFFGNPFVFAGRRSSYTDYLEIQYTYGRLDVPDDLKLAALGIAAGFYNWASEGQKEVVSSQIGSYRVQYAQGSNGQGSSNSTADMNFATISRYATKRF